MAAVIVDTQGRILYDQYAKKGVSIAMVFIQRYFIAALHVLWVFSFGIFSKKCRGHVHRLYLLFTKTSNSGQTKSTAIIPKMTINEFLPDSVCSPIKLLQIQPNSGNVSVLELATLTRIIADRFPQRCFEIGTFDGRTTLNMAANCQPEGLVFTLDLPKKEIDSTRLKIDAGDIPYIEKEMTGVKFLGTSYKSRIKQLYGDSATFDFSPYHNTIDFIFVDGSHSYEYVKNDSEIALSLLRNGKGTILWHDYDNSNWEGVTRALNELYSGDKRLNGMRHIENTSLIILRL